jgi:hypothetical protein
VYIIRLGGGGGVGRGVSRAQSGIGGGGPFGGVISCTPAFRSLFKPNPNNPQQNSVAKQQTSKFRPARREVESSEPEAQQNENADNGGNQV